jgi:hypothetical protein
LVKELIEQSSSS